MLTSNLTLFALIELSFGTGFFENTVSTAKLPV
jgi:hypothetical protein